MSYGFYKQTGIPIKDEPMAYGNVYFVDGTNGLDSNLGTSPRAAFQTIQRAFTVQLADTDGLGDVINVLPGTYAESVYTPSMDNVLLQGCGFTPDAVRITPTTSHALLIGVDGTTSSTMTNSKIRNITFRPPSSTNPTYAALTIGYMTKSVVEDCKFRGITWTGVEAAGTIGLQIGNRTDTAMEFHEHSRISRCEFTTDAGRSQVLGYGIMVGTFGTATPAHKGFKNMIIEDCDIQCLYRGIQLYAGAASCGGTIIRRNTVNSHSGGNGPYNGIVSGSTTGTDQLCMLHDNRLTCAQDVIVNFSSCNCQGNLVSIAGSVPDAEYLDGS